MGQKPDDWRTASLCRTHHGIQHAIGEQSFWKAHEIDPEALVAEFAKASPKAREIADIKRERGL